jgi:lysozyme
MARLDGPQAPRPIEPMTPPSSGKAKLTKTVGGTAAVALLALVGTWEGKSNDPYKDLVGIPTVCYGETHVSMRHYSDAQCEEMLASHLADTYARAVLERNPEIKWHPYALAAAASLTYNIGVSSYRGSTAAKRFDKSDWRGGCDAFLMWDRAHGRVIPGLHNRRLAERKVCLSGL